MRALRQEYACTFRGNPITGALDSPLSRRAHRDEILMRDSDFDLDIMLSGIGADLDFACKVELYESHGLYWLDVFDDSGRHRERIAITDAEAEPYLDTLSQFSAARWLARAISEQRNPRLVVHEDGDAEIHLDEPPHPVWSTPGAPDVAAFVYDPDAVLPIMIELERVGRVTVSN